MREEGVAVRQPPWITFALILVLLSSFAWLRVERHRVEAELGGALTEAAEYFRTHSYLGAPPLLEEQLGATQIAQMRARHLAAQRSRDALPVPAGIQRREQERLDALVSEAAGRLTQHPTQRWGMRADEHRPLALVSHVLLHAGWLHLLASLCALLLLGFYLESSWGASLFAGVALGGAIAAASAFDALASGSGAGWIGSAGLLAGLLGAFAIRFGAGWRDPARALVFAVGAGVLAVPLLIGVQWSVLRGEALLPVSVSAFALAAAFAFGAAAAAGIRFAQIEQVFGRREAGAGRVGATSAQLERALEHRAAGRLDQAFTLLVNRLRENPNDREAALALWDVASDLGRPAAAAPALIGLIRDEIKRGANQQAIDHWLELSEAGLERDAEPALALRIAVLLNAEGQRTAAAHALQHALARAEGASGTALASRVARAASSIDPETAAEAAWRALGSAELTLEERQGLESVLAEVLPRNAEAARSAASRRPPVSKPEPPRREPPRAAAVAVKDPEAELIEFVDAESGAAAGASAPPGHASAREAAPPGERRASRHDETTKPEAIEIETASRTLEAIFAVPTAFDADGLCITASNGAKKRVRWDRIAAISVVAVSHLGPKPVILVDLILNWMSLADEPLRIIRLRGDRFDPRKLAPEQTVPVDALRAVIARLLKESNATPLPDLQSAKGLPFAGFDDLASYHRDVLMVDGDNADAYAWSTE